MICLSRIILAGLVTDKGQAQLRWLKLIFFCTQAESSPSKMTSSNLQIDSMFLLKKLDISFSKHGRAIPRKKQKGRHQLDLSGKDVLECMHV